MSPSIKLTYFNLRGRAEMARLSLHAAGIAFEDERIGFDAWPARKPLTPFGSLPLLQYNGQEIGQSLTITRFLAKQAGLAGRNELEEAKVSMVVDHFADAFGSKC